MKIDHITARDILMTRIQCLRDTNIVLNALVDPVLVSIKACEDVYEYGILTEDEQMEINEDEHTFPVVEAMP